MQNIKKVYVVGNQKNYADFLDNFVLVDCIKDADIVIFTGGEDVTPSLYGCQKHPTTYSNIERDLAEQAEFNKIRQDQLAIGICRGSQLLCVLNGGKLIQNVDNHAIRHTHVIYELKSDYVYDITSTHHQMQYPFEIPSSNWTCLFASFNLSSKYEGNQISTPSFEPEIVLYHQPNKPKCLAIQGHVEYMRHDSPIVVKINEIINTLLKNED